LTFIFLHCMDSWITTVCALGQTTAAEKLLRSFFTHPKCTNRSVPPLNNFIALWLSQAKSHPKKDLCQLLQTQLQCLRHTLPTWFKPCSAEKRTSLDNSSISPKQIFSIEAQLSTNLLDFTRRILQIAITSLGPPPQAFVIFALGSLSLQGATPYSDVEYGLLLEKKIMPGSTDEAYFRDFLEIVHGIIASLGEQVEPWTGYHVDDGMHPVVSLKGGIPRLQGISDFLTQSLTATDFALEDKTNNALQHPRYILGALANTDNLCEDSCLANDGEHPQLAILWEQFSQALARQKAALYDPHAFPTESWQARRALAHLTMMLRGNYDEKQTGQLTTRLPSAIHHRSLSHLVDIKKELYAPLKYWLMDLANYHGLSYHSVPEALTVLMNQQKLHPLFTQATERVLAAIISIRYRAQLHAGHQGDHEWVHSPALAEEISAYTYIASQDEWEILEEVFYTIIQPCYLMLHAWGLTEFYSDPKSAEKKEASFNAMHKVRQNFRNYPNLDPIQALIDHFVEKKKEELTASLSLWEHQALFSIAWHLHCRWQRVIPAQAGSHPTASSWLCFFYQTIYSKVPEVVQTAFSAVLGTLKVKIEPTWILRLKILDYLAHPQNELSNTNNEELIRYLLEQVKEDAFDRNQHWNNLPFAVQRKLMYVLEQQCGEIKYAPLCYDLKYRLKPDGWCYQWEYQKRLWESEQLFWYVTQDYLQNMKENDPTVPDIEIKVKRYQNKRVIKEYLHPEVIKCLVFQNLIDKQGNWTPIKQKPHFRQHVFHLTLPTPRGKLARWFKVNPERPGGELMADSFSRRLGCRAPWAEIVAWQLADKQWYPVLVSEHIAGKNLQEMVASCTENGFKPIPDAEKNLSQRLDGMALTQQILRTILVGQADGKWDNYIVEEFINAEGKTKYRFVAIDNERAFWPYLVRLPNQQPAPLCKDVHFAMQAFYEEGLLNEKVCQAFVALNQKAVFEAWLLELQIYEETFATLFQDVYTKPQVETLFDKIKATFINIELPPILAIPLTQTTLRRLVTKWKQLHEVLSLDNQTKTGYWLLEKMENGFAHYLYQIMLSPLPSLQATWSQHLFERFNQLFGEGYEAFLTTSSLAKCGYHTGQDPLLKSDLNLHEDFSDYLLTIKDKRTQEDEEWINNWLNDRAHQLSHHFLVVIEKGHKQYEGLIYDSTSGDWQHKIWAYSQLSSAIKALKQHDKEKVLNLQPQDRSLVFGWLTRELPYTRFMAWQKILQQTAGTLGKDAPSIERLIGLLKEDPHARMWQHFDFSQLEKDRQEQIYQGLRNFPDEIYAFYFKKLTILTIEKLWALLDKFPLLSILDVSGCHALANNLFDFTGFISKRGVTKYPSLAHIIATDLNPDYEYSLTISQPLNALHQFLGIQYLNLSRCPKLTSLDCKLPHLTVLKLNKNTAMHQLELDTPLLTQLELEKCTRLSWADVDVDNLLAIYPKLDILRLPTQQLAWCCLEYFEQKQNKAAIILLGKTHLAGFPILDKEKQLHYLQSKLPKYLDDWRGGAFTNELTEDNLDSFWSLPHSYKEKLLNNLDWSRLRNIQEGLLTYILQRDHWQKLIFLNLAVGYLSYTRTIQRINTGMFDMFAFSEELLYIEYIPIGNSFNILQSLLKNSKLKTLFLQNCKEIDNLFFKETPYAIQTLHLKELPQLATLGDKQNLLSFSSLKVLRIENCSNLTSININAVKLYRLHISETDNLLFLQTKSQKLKSFFISDLQLLPIEEWQNIMDVKYISQLHYITSKVDTLPMKCPVLLGLSWKEAFIPFQKQFSKRLLGYFEKYRFDYADIPFNDRQKLLVTVEKVLPDLVAYESLLLCVNANKITTKASILLSGYLNPNYAKLEKEFDEFIPIDKEAANELISQSNPAVIKSTDSDSLIKEIAQLVKNWRRNADMSRLINFLQDPDPRVKITVIEALKTLHDRPVTKALILALQPCLSDWDAKVRSLTIALFASLFSKSAATSRQILRALSITLKKTSELARIHAALALVYCLKEKTPAYLVHILTKTLTKLSVAELEKRGLTSQYNNIQEETTKALIALLQVAKQIRIVAPLVEILVKSFKNPHVSLQLPIPAEINNWLSGKMDQLHEALLRDIQALSAPTLEKNLIVERFTHLLENEGFAFTISRSEPRTIIIKCITKNNVSIKKLDELAECIADVFLNNGLTASSCQFEKNWGRLQLTITASDAAVMNSISGLLQRSGKKYFTSRENALLFFKPRFENIPIDESKNTIECAFQ
jgi:hypothetical protein